jgi:integrase
MTPAKPAADVSTTTLADDSREVVALKDSAVRALRSRATRYDVAMSGGIGLQVRVNTRKLGSTDEGTKSFRWVYHSKLRPGKVGTVTLGRWGDGTGGTITVKQAQAKLEEEKAKLRAGIEPGTAPRGDGPRTVSDLCEAFYTNEIEGHRKRPDVVRDILDRDIIATIGSTPLDDVTALVAAEPAEAAVARKARVHASKVLQVTKQMFAYAAIKGHVPMSPAASLKPGHIKAKGRVAKVAAKGTRWLRTEELVTFWGALDRASVDPTTRLGLQLLILTALRTNEALTLKWADIFFEKKILVLRAENRKMTPAKAEEAGDWIQPLSDDAIEVLKTLRALCPKDKEWVFYSRRAAEEHTDDHALGHAMRRIWQQDGAVKALAASMKQKAETDPSMEDIKRKPKASPHDFRRTVATHLVSTLKVDRVVAQMVLGHSINKAIGSGVGDTYDRGAALDERRAALNGFASWLKGEVSRAGKAQEQGSANA